MLRELPRTSKKTSPSRGSGAASDADMLPIVACLQEFVQFVRDIATNVTVTRSPQTVMRAGSTRVSLQRMPAEKILRATGGKIATPRAFPGGGVAS
jgi:hypothetical protein